MRLNQFLAKHTDLSRRSADKAIADGRVEINGIQAKLGDIVVEKDLVTLDSHAITTTTQTQTLILHKPVGYVVSRTGQGSKTVYDLLPAKYHHLNAVGRLDKDSSGLLLMTNDGELANQLTHPRYAKDKRYLIELNKKLQTADLHKIIGTGVDIGDTRPSKFRITPITDTKLSAYLNEGRNRQIRRTFESLGYKVVKLHRTNFGDYQLGSLKSGDISVIVSK